MKRLYSLAFFLLSIHIIYAQIVDTQFGKIEGSINGGIYKFLGIPFAKAPVDTLRWKAPQTPSTWTDTLNTKIFAPVCPQKEFKQGATAGIIKGEEDCLYLNIWTPDLSGDLPVLFFIHGGGNQQGGAGENDSTNIYDGTNMSKKGNAVIVTIQYRLGPLGYLVHPGLEKENTENTSGNYGVMDQLLALQWVQNNISNFGGNANKVMIFGESAGGVNVGNLLTTPLAANLFQRACIQSAAPTITSYDEVKNNGIAYVDSFITTGTNTDKINYLRTLPPDTLVKYEKMPMSGGISQGHWQPVIDNIIFSGSANTIFQSGSFNKVPLMIGSNSEETSISSPPIVTPSMVNALVASYFPFNQTEALALYPAGSTNEEAKNSYIGLTTDAQFTLGTRRTAQCVSENQNNPVWRYFFTHKHNYPPALESYGSYHGIELFYIFNNWENITSSIPPFFSIQDDSVQTNMLKYWVNFADTGNPNGIELEKWPEYNNASDCYLEIKATPDGSKIGVRREKCDFFDSASFYTECTTSLTAGEIKNNSIFTIYPNPSNRIFHVESKTSENFKLSIYDSNGKKIIDGENISNLDLSPFPSGIYNVLINQNKNNFQTKLIKQ